MKLTARSDLNGIDSRQASPSWLEKIGAMLCQSWYITLSKGHRNSLPAASSFAIWAQGSAGLEALTEAVAALATAARAATAESRDILGDITCKS